MAKDNYVTIIGPPRSGTTWLFRYLRGHPDVFVPFIKEINWFNIATGLANENQIANIKARYEEIRDNRAARGLDLGEQGQERKERYEMQTDADFRAFFEKRVEGDMPYFDISPGYSGLDVAGFARLHATFPKAKVVILLRNKPDRAWSVVHHVKKRRFPEADRAFVISYLSNAQDGPMTKLLSEIYATVTTVFDPSRVLCLYTEELFAPKTQQITLDRLSDFVGVPSHSVGDFEFSANRGSYAQMPWSFRKEATLKGAADYTWAQTHMGYLPPAWEKDYGRFLVPQS